MISIEIPGVGSVPIPPLGARTNRDTGEFSVLGILAYLEGEVFGNPPSVCPVIAEGVANAGRIIPDRIRHEIFLPRLGSFLGTRSTKHNEQLRSFLAVDWACRVGAPRALRSAGLYDEVPKLEELPITEDRESASQTSKTARALAQRLRSGFTDDDRRVIANAVRACDAAYRSAAAAARGKTKPAAFYAADVALYAGASDPSIWGSWGEMIDRQVALTPHPERQIDAEHLRILRQVYSEEP